MLEYYFGKKWFEQTTDYVEKNISKDTACFMRTNKEVAKAAIDEAAQAAAATAITVAAIIAIPGQIADDIAQMIGSRIEHEVEWMQKNPGKATLKLTKQGLCLVTGYHAPVLIMLAKEGANLILSSVIESQEVKDRLKAVSNAHDIFMVVKYAAEESSR